jgi:hypothetical protein
MSEPNGSREQFERYVIEAKLTGSVEKFAQRPDEYKFMQTAALWQLWAASAAHATKVERAKVVKEVRGLTCDPTYDNHFRGGYATAITDAIDRITKGT